jgi:uncharacterized glyoxalase superfamily protein PhnB
MNHGSTSEHDNDRCARHTQAARFLRTGSGLEDLGPASDISVMYKVGHSVLVFLNAAYLAQERGEPLTAGSKTSLAVLLESSEKVEEIYKRALAAGATQTSGVKNRDGGLYTGYFADPEGNSWEVVWSPHMPLDADGALTFPAQ